MPREILYGINTALKFKILAAHNITRDETKKKENYDQLEDYGNYNLCKKEADSIEITHKSPMPPLKPEVGKRIYSSKGKTIKFH